MKDLKRKDEICPKYHHDCTYRKDCKLVPSSTKIETAKKEIVPTIVPLMIGSVDFCKIVANKSMEGTVKEAQRKP